MSEKLDAVIGGLGFLLIIAAIIGLAIAFQ